MTELVENLLTLLREHVGLYVPESIVPIIVFLFFVGSIVASYISAWLVFKRYVKALSTELEQTNTDVANNLHSVSRRLEERLDAIREIVTFKNEVVGSGEDGEVEKEPAAQPNRSFRLSTARTVAQKVLEKWLEGRTFDKNINDPGRFDFLGVSEAGLEFRIVLHTPYRNGIAQDGRLAYALDIWVDNRKHLNFEWDQDGEYALRGFKRGDWSEDLSSWNVSRHSQAIDVRRSVGSATVAA